MRDATHRALGPAFSRSATTISVARDAITKLSLERLTTGLAHQFSGRRIGINCIRIDEVVPTEAVT